MRVLHVVSYYAPAIEWGGPARSIPSLVDAQAQLGADLHVVTTTTRGAADLEPLPVGEKRVGEATVHFFQAHGPRRFFFSPGLARGLVSQIRAADVVHIHGLFAFPIVAAARLARFFGRPYVVSPRGMLNQWALRYRGMKKRAYMHLVEERTLRSAAMLHFSSSAERDECPEQLRNIPSCVLPNGVDLEGLDRVPLAPRAGPPTVAMIGRLHPVKGFDVALPMLALLRQRFPDVILALAGHDEEGYRAEIERQAQTLGVSASLEFLGNLERPALCGLFERSRVVIVPSHQESFGLAAVEAMAAARPVVMSRAVNIAGDVGSGDAASVVDRTPEAFADAVGRLFDKPTDAQALGSRARRYVAEHYERRAVARAFLEVYRGLAPVT